MMLRFLLLWSWVALSLGAERVIADAAPRVKGLCIPAPSSHRLDEFLQFIQSELVPHGVNLLILRVDYQFQFKSRPEMASSNGLSVEQAKRLAEACRRSQIHLIPLVNLLGHQSWETTCGKLLQVHPELDETPGVQLPKKYQWPNSDRLYCKSYCPRHPQIHDIVFPLVDEVCDAFSADAFHAGMDEVFYIGEEQCPRCRGHHRGDLFAEEVTAIRDHLHSKQRRLWIWGDRLLDGKTTGMGEWEASLNDTHTAIDRISRDVVICDWHYERPDPTPVYFAMKGFDVVTCCWRNPSVASQQASDMLLFREHAAKAMKPRFLGMMQTVWSGCDSFLDEYSGRKTTSESKNPDHTEAKCFRKLLEHWDRFP